MEYLSREVQLMHQMDHPNIVKFYDVYEDAKYMHIVMEYLSGGELFDEIVRVGAYSEQTAAEYMRQILHSIAFLHTNGIVHRDIKPENFLFESKEANAELKLIDFGLSVKH
jgi:calcium-dependent protein kinase